MIQFESRQKCPCGNDGRQDLRPTFTGAPVLGVLEDADRRTGPLATDHRLVAEISTSALQANLALLRGRLKPPTKFCAVVKADCYGHGWSQCGEVITEVADWLAVATPDEAFALRQTGCQLPILLFMSGGFLGKTSGETMRQLIAEGVTLTVTTAADLAAISAAAESVGQMAQVAGTIPYEYIT